MTLEFQASHRCSDPRRRAAPRGRLAGPRRPRPGAGDRRGRPPAGDGAAPATRRRRPAEAERAAGRDDARRPRRPSGQAGARARARRRSRSTQLPRRPGRPAGGEPPAGVILDEKTGKVKDTRKWIHRYSPERHLFELGDVRRPQPAARRPRPLQAGAWAGPTSTRRCGAWARRWAPAWVTSRCGSSASRPSSRRRRPSSATSTTARRSSTACAAARCCSCRTASRRSCSAATACSASARRASGLGSDIDPGRPLGRRPQDLHLAHGGVPRRRAPHHLGQGGQAGAGAFTSHAQVTVGFSLVLGRVRPQPAPKDLDWDKDGVQNDVDKCPKLAGDPPDGCPSIDSDNDTFLDKVDKCPFEPGVAPDGCPPPDTDKDGIIDPDDQCPTEPWPEPPAARRRPTPTRTGSSTSSTSCPMHPESYNGFEDDDGCPDKLPEKARSGTTARSRASTSRPGPTRSRGARKTLDPRGRGAQGVPASSRSRSRATPTTSAGATSTSTCPSAAPTRSRTTWSRRASTPRGSRPPASAPTSRSTRPRLLEGRAKNRRIEFKVLIDRPEARPRATTATRRPTPEPRPAGGGK